MTSLTHTHFARQEALLLAHYESSKTGTASTNLGNAREAFVDKFLKGHLGSHLGIGNGEVIDAESQDGVIRPQVDVLVHYGKYPRLLIGGKVNAYFVESVVATIEVKSTVNKDEFRAAVKAAKYLKSLKMNATKGLSVGFDAPGPYAYVVAYDGPTQPETIRGWIKEIYPQEGIAIPTLPATRDERAKVVCPAIDGVFVLGKSFLLFDNTPISLVKGDDLASGKAQWWGYEAAGIPLSMLFFQLLEISSGLSAARVDATAYYGSTPVGRGIAMT